MEKRLSYISYRQLQGFPDSSVTKESACSARDPCLIPGLGRSPGEGKGYQLQYCSLENSMDYIVHGVTKSQPQLKDFHFHFHTCTRQLQKIMREQIYGCQ